MYQTPVKLGEGGRIVIPAEYRKAMGIEVGDELILHVDQGNLIVMTRKMAIAHVQEQMASYSTGGRMLSEELIEERREQARHD